MNGNRMEKKLLLVSFVWMLGLVLAACQPAAAQTSQPEAMSTATGSATGIKSATSTPAVPVTGSQVEDYGYGVSKPTAATGSGSGALIKTTSKEGLGTFLVDEKGMTLYLFTKDSPGVSNCKEACLDAWPPLLTEGEPLAGEGVTGKLGTITRDDGTVQVTYDDMPLYYYVSDVEPGDTTGQGVGGVWYVVEP